MGRSRAYIADCGEKWDSEYEYRAYSALRAIGFDLRRCSAGQGDSFDYTSTITKGSCLECGSTSVGQARTYTPDFYIDEAADYAQGLTGYYVEAKGYWPGPRRSLIRQAAKGREDLRLLFVFQSRAKLRGTTMLPHEYVEKYFPRAKAVYFHWRRQLMGAGPLDKLTESLRRQLSEI